MTETVRCPWCGASSPADFRFCGHCGGGLAAGAVAAGGVRAGAVPGSPATPVRGRAEERKVVTTLFCDLVGFTAMSEAADPEDVDELLGRYHEAARRVIEAYGGTVEKFIGDAVVGVFGVPAVHEDDPERAVRAGLIIIESLAGFRRPDGTPLQVRVGVNTGEAVVRLDVDPASGRGFLTGDAVNTAARLQAAAPPGGVVVGEATRASCSRGVDFRRLDPVHAKGKAEPVAAWRALTAEPPSRARPAPSPGARITPFVGRTEELDSIVSLCESTVSLGRFRTALVVGEPGIGKSRLVAEALNELHARDATLVHHVAGCLPYGESLPLAALAQLVRSLAHVSEDDDAQTVERKLNGILPVDDERAWLRNRAGALLGLPAPSASSPLESHIAWRRLLEHAATSSPLVIVVEDLQWADEPLLAFLRYLVDEQPAVPLALLTTARPAAFEASGVLDAGHFDMHVRLGALPDDAVARLVDGVMDGRRVGGDQRATVVARAGGNPFFAEELARLFGSGPRVSPATLPPSLTGVIGARLDALPPQDKALLADASVLGLTFWPQALSAVGGGTAGDVSVALERLCGHGLIRRSSCSSVGGQEEFAFCHVLAHDVAYGQLTRVARAKAHRAAGRWLLEAGVDRADDQKRHLTAAFELGEELHDKSLSDSVRRPAALALAAAADRALPFDVEAAERDYRRALDLLERGDPARVAVLAHWGDALDQRGCYRESAEAYEEAASGHLAAGDLGPAAVAMERQAFVLGNLGEPDRAHEIVMEAKSLAEDAAPSADKITVLAAWVGWLLCMEQRESAIAAVDEAVSLAAQQRLPLPVRAVGFRGWARCETGDAGGFADYDAAISAAQLQGLSREAVMNYDQRGQSLLMYRGPRRALAAHREGREFAERRGIVGWTAWLDRSVMDDSVWAGAWDEALAIAERIAPLMEEAEDMDLITVWSDQLLVLAARGQHRVETVTRESWLEAAAERRLDPALPLHAMVGVAVSAAARGDAEVASRALAAAALTDVRESADYALRLPALVRLWVARGDAEQAARATDGVPGLLPVQQHALASARAYEAEARGQGAEAAAGFADTARRWHDFGVPYEEGHALLGQGRCLVALGRAQEAAEPLAAARVIFAALSAQPALDETDGLLVTVGLAVSGEGRPRP